MLFMIMYFVCACAPQRANNTSSLVLTTLALALMLLQQLAHTEYTIQLKKRLLLIMNVSSHC